MQKQFNFYLFSVFFAVVLITPCFALANAGVPLIAILFSIGFIYPFYPLIILMVVILIETVILKIILKINYSKALIYSLSTNIVSAIAGVIIYGGTWLLISIFSGLAMTIFFPLLYLVWISPNASMTDIIMQILVNLSIAFLLSVFIEYFILKLFLKNFDKKDIKKGAWIANSISYIFLVVVIVIVFLYQFQIETNKRNERELEQQGKDEAKAEYISQDNWQVYKNAQYNFEFKYPSDFLVEEPKIFSCSSNINMVGNGVCPYINIINKTFVNWNVVGKDDVFLEKKEMDNVFFCQSFGVTNNVIYFAVKPKNGDCFVMSLKMKEYQDCDKIVEMCPRSAEPKCSITFQQKRTDCRDNMDLRDQVINKLSDTFKF